MSKSKHIFSHSGIQTGYESTKTFPWRSVTKELSRDCQFSTDLFSSFDISFPHSGSCHLELWPLSTSQALGLPSQDWPRAGSYLCFILCAIHHAARHPASPRLASRTGPCMDYPWLPSASPPQSRDQPFKLLQAWVPAQPAEALGPWRQQEKPPLWEARVPQWRVTLSSLWLCSNEDPAQLKINQYM